MAASAPGTVSTSCPHCVKRRDRMSRIGASSSTTRILAITVHRIFVRTAVFSHRCLDYTSGKERLDPFFQHHGNFEVSARVEVAVVHFGFVGAFGEHFSVAELHFDAVSPLFGDFNRIAPIYAGRRFEPRTRFGVDDRNLARNERDRAVSSTHDSGDRAAHLEARVSGNDRGVAGGKENECSGAGGQPHLAGSSRSGAKRTAQVGSSSRIERAESVPFAK